MAALAALAVLLDIWRRDKWSIGLTRQTDRRWRLLLGPNWGAFTWGVDIGSGFTTIRVTAGFWLIVAIALIANPWWAPIVTIVPYAVGQLVALLASVPKSIEVHLAVMRQQFPLAIIKTTWASLVVLWTIGLVLSSLA